jgi:hypothetical protein
MMGKLPTRRDTGAMRNMAQTAYHMLWMWTIRTLCQKLPTWTVELSPAGTR